MVDTFLPVGAIKNDIALEYFLNLVSIKPCRAARKSIEQEYLNPNRQSKLSIQIHFDKTLEKI